MGGVWTDAAALLDTTEKAACENAVKMTERLTRNKRTRRKELAAGA